MKTKTILKILIMLLFVIAATMQVKTQIVYVDINPDTTIFIPNEIDSTNSFYLDVNNNSVIDFGFHLSKYKSNEQVSTAMSVYAYNYFSGGKNKVTMRCEGGTYYPILNFNDTIFRSNYWAGRTNISLFDNMFPFSCNPPIDEFYLGLKFLNNTDTLHGWVRILATNSSITLKDYAYNTIPNMPILAGQTELGIGNFAPSSNINIFENNGFLYINITQPAQAQGYIRIYSQQGALVKADSINGQQNTIPLAGLAQGIYIVQVATQSEIVNKQIFLLGN